MWNKMREARARSAIHCGYRWQVAPTMTYQGTLSEGSVGTARGRDRS